MQNRLPRHWSVFFPLILLCLHAGPLPAGAASTTCNSCTDCNTKLNGGVYDTVNLSVDITNHPGHCIAINRSNVTFDCQDHLIDGDGFAIDPENGVGVTNSSGVRVQNCEITGFTKGIQLFNSSGATVTGNTVTGNEGAALEFSSSSSNAVSDNTLDNNNQGIVFSNSNSNAINENQVCGNRTNDFEIVSGTGNYGDNNACNVPNGWNDTGATGCTNLCPGTVTCDSCSDCTAKLTGTNTTVILTTTISNHVGTCVSFGKNDAVFDCDGHTIDGDGTGTDYGVRINGWDRNTVKNCTIRDFYEGILVQNSADYNTLDRNTLRANRNNGIRLYEADHNTIAYYNSSYSNLNYGISLFRSHYNSILMGTVSANGAGGVRLDESDNNTITDNSITGHLGTDIYGIILYGSERNALARNTLTGNNYGILFDQAGTRFNQVNGNRVCSASTRDFRSINLAADNNGDTNTCDYPGSWEDSGRPWGCTFRCSSCGDGIRNYDETGIDCGGSYCPPCADCDTTARYAPPDTECRNIWPTTEGPTIDINTSDDACSLFEVCDPSLDFIIEDALDCCENEDYLSVLGGPRLDGKREACRNAHENSYGGNFRDSFDTVTLKKCLGRYIIRALGSGAVYMQGYFRGEFCCLASEELCGEATPECPYYWTAPAAWEMGTPDSCSHRVEETPDFIMGGHRCVYNSFLWWDWGEAGWWSSDTNYRSNNDSAADVPAHASINKLSTGTCVDYSIATTTLLRKAGYLEDEVYSVDGDGHDYNLVRFPDEAQWYYTDTTGNASGVKRNPDFHCCKGTLDRCDRASTAEECAAAAGCIWSGSACAGTPEEDSCRVLDAEADCTAVASCAWEVCGYDYCRKLDQGCYNDNHAPSQGNCPDNTEIHGCEAVTDSAAASAAVLPKPPPAETATDILGMTLAMSAEVDGAAASLDEMCTELNPCTLQNAEDAPPPAPKLNFSVEKALSSTVTQVGGRITVKLSVTNRENVPIIVTVRENFISGVTYVGLSGQAEWMEGLRNVYHQWRLGVFAGGTNSITFEVEPHELGRVNLSPTLVSAGATLEKGSSPAIRVLCKPDGVCGPGEDNHSCTPDCPSGGDDGFCDRRVDGVNDPDCRYGVDPDFNPKADTDGDGVADMDDRCPRTPEGAAVDTAGCACGQKSCDDGNPKTIDRCTAYTAACSHLVDLDMDEVADAKDNCPGEFNPDQRDSDRDRVGDQCEIEPITTNITLPKGTYYINDYAKQGAVVFAASNVTLDCGGSTLIGDGNGYGVYVPPGVNKVTIKNCLIKNYAYGIFLDKGGDHRILNSRLEENVSGVVLGASLRNTLSGNTMRDNSRAGLTLDGGGEHTLTANTVASNGAGILLLSSAGNTATDNTVCENTHLDFYVASSVHTGKNNTCTRPDGWNDDGHIGCTGRCPNTVCENDRDCDRDVDGLDVASFLKNGVWDDLELLAEDFGRTNCPACSP